MTTQLDKLKEGWEEKIGIKSYKSDKAREIYIKKGSK